MALDTIRLVQENIHAVDEDPKNLKAREGLMLAATLGGLAFSNASICLVHELNIWKHLKKLNLLMLLLTLGPL